MAQLNTSSRNGRGKRHRIHLDMTPMVDLAFLLLTFFVLTVTLNHSRILDIEKQAEDVNSPAPPIEAERVITVILGEKDNIYWYHGMVDPVLEKTDYTKDGIRKILLQKQAEIPRMVLLVKPSSKSRYKNLVDIIDVINNAPIKEYYVVKETAFDKELVLANNQ